MRFLTLLAVTVLCATPTAAAQDPHPMWEREHRRVVTQIVETWLTEPVDEALLVELETRFRKLQLYVAFGGEPQRVIRLDFDRPIPPQLLLHRIQELGIRVPGSSTRDRRSSRTLGARR